MKLRVAAISDIHGNLPALEAVLADIGRLGGCDQILVAGDLAFGGPWPAEVLDRLCALDLPVVQGNTDAFFSPGLPPCDGALADMVEWGRGRLGDARCAWLAGLPFSHRLTVGPGHDLLMAHANLRDFHEPLFPSLSDQDVEALLGREPECDWDVLVYGHLHVPGRRNWRGRLLVNVASVGQPQDGDPRAVYAVLTWDGDGWQAEHRRVRYDVPVVVHEILNCGMPGAKRIAGRLMHATPPAR